MGAKITAFAYLLRSYRKSLRKSAVIFSLAFLFMALQVVGDVLSYERITSVMEAMAASLVFYAVMLLFNEEGFSLNLHKGLVISSTPFALALYMLASEALGVSADWMATVGVTYGVSGLFMVFSGVVLLGMTELYGNDVRYLGTLLILYGLHEMDYPFLRPVGWFAPIGFSISAALTILLALAVVRFSTAEWFVGLPTVPEVKELDLAPGTILITSEEYRRMLPELGNLSVLAFLRKITDPPSSWTVYFVTQVEGERNIPPTNLPRILELSNRYLNSLEGRGIVVLDCLEYLNIYNGFDALAKFLGALRDFAVIHKGTVIIVSERSAWNEREWRLLQRILSG
ncbi:DUF835 domain-containing protein [Thermococcus profundus]|uniref:DUF835 domain-containing protein n=1 Tax=Thermococcus profundus TaxID=49899 RepID=UPI001E5B64B0|nr:DUF835 domain-containing protein [Thermococcus profundus]